MRRLLGVGAAVLGLSTALVAPAEAAKPFAFVDILTTQATAIGDVYVDDLTGQTRVFRPTFATDMNVRCRAGREAAVTVSPVAGMTNNGVSFTCTGKQQVVTFPSTAATPEFGWHDQTVSVNLRYVGAGRTRAADAQRVYVDTSSEDGNP